MFQNSPWPWLPLFHTAQNPDPISLQTWWTGIFMKHTPARGKAHRPVLGESAGLATGPCKKTPGGTHCVGRASPFGPHPWKEKRDFLGGPVVKTLCFHCRARGFHLWLGKIPHAAWHGQKKKGKRVPHTPATHPDTPFYCPCHFPSVHFFPYQMFPSSPYLPHSPFLKTQTKSISSTLDSQWIQSTLSLSTWQVLTFLFLVCNGACMYAL